MTDQEVLTELKNEFRHKKANGYEPIIAAEKALNMLDLRQYQIVLRLLQANHHNISKKLIAFGK